MVVCAEAEPAAEGVACCDVVTRGLAYDNGKIFLNTLDDYSVAMDANTGKELWHTKLGDINKGETITMAPLVVKGKVLIGNSGGEMGVRGWVTALDENTGKIVWRAYSHRPRQGRADRPELQAHYQQDKGKDLGVNPGRRTIGRSAAARSGAGFQYDPETNLDLLRHRQSRPVELQPAARRQSLDHARSSRAMPTPARRYGPIQLDPHDLWDYDEINENVLLDLPINGATRKVLVHPGRNGYMYVIDRRPARSSPPTLRLPSTRSRAST